MNKVEEAVEQFIRYQKRMNNVDVRPGALYVLIQEQRQAAVEELMPVVRAAVEMKNWLKDAGIDGSDFVTKDHPVKIIILAVEALPVEIINKAKGE